MQKKKNYFQEINNFFLNLRLILAKKIIFVVSFICLVYNACPDCCNVSGLPRVHNAAHCGVPHMAYTAFPYERPPAAVEPSVAASLKKEYAAIRDGPSDP
jgi:hypothetical protein